MINKKGSAADLFLVVVFIAAGAIFLLVGHYALGIMMPAIQAELPSAEADAAIQSSIDAMDTFDSFLLAIYIGLVLAMLLTAFMIKTHPAFIFVFIIAVILAILVSVPLSNSYQLIQNDVGLSAEFGMTDFIMNNLPLLTAIFGFIFVIVTYVKAKASGGE